MLQRKEQIYTTLNNGTEMPLLGLGVYDMHGGETIEAVEQALEIGYRLIDTAAMYGNEKEVGQAFRNSGLKRADVFITTKVNNMDHGYDKALAAFDQSLKKLNLEYVDLYLIHWPIRGKRKETWKALETIYASKRAKAIGVANYLLPFLQELQDYAEIVPAADQVEFTPFLYQKELLDYCKKRNIQLQSYTPLTRGIKLKEKKVVELAEKYHKTPAQLILRWNLQHGVSTIPKSSNPKRLRENFDVFDFEISPDDLAIMDTWNEDLRLVGDPLGML
jgi:methylglyoxal/glyoxal reductase